jgi:hypothetical protein
MVRERGFVDGQDGADGLLLQPFPGVPVVDAGPFSQLGHGHWPGVGQRRVEAQPIAEVQAAARAALADDSTCASVFIDVPPPGCARTFPPRSAPAAEPVRRSAWQRARTPSAVGIPGGPLARSRPRR